MSALDQILNFSLNGTYTSEEFVYRASTRSEITGRLLHWAKLLQQNGYSLETSSLVISVVGEIANNCFDHNLGKWKDQVGCLLSFDFLPDRLRIAIIDRGQGIADSLKVVRPEISNPAEYLVLAFETIISGRAPEQRGNGLKYVSKNFLDLNGLELFCVSSQHTYRRGSGSELEKAFAPVSKFDGTIVAIDWKREGTKK